MPIPQSAQVENHFQVSRIEGTCSNRNSLCPKQQQKMESQSISIHSDEMLILQSVQAVNPSQKEQIQAIGNL
jgi:hypothetical protein